MWLLTNFGFFSIVQKIGDSDLTIRSRIKTDLEVLRERYLPSLAPTIKGEGDYPYRAKASHTAVADATAKIVKDIHYPNFKNSVSETQGDTRSELYREVWQTLGKLKDEPALANSSGRSDVAASASENESFSTISVSVAEVLKDYEENEIYADKKYKGKTLRIQGFVESVTVCNDAPCVYVSRTWRKNKMIAWRIACFFDNSATADLAQLRKSIAITVQGDCVVRDGALVLHNCRLIKEDP